MKLHLLIYSLLFITLVNAETYTVKKGDSLSQIASKHGMTSSQLIKLNGIKDPNKLKIGQRLRTKKSSRPSSNATSHKVASGDTFYRIADKYDLSFEQLKAANPGINPSKLAVGQVIKLTPPVKQPQPAQPAVTEAPQPVAPPAAPVEQSQPAVTEAPQPAAPVAPPAPTKLTKVVITEPVSLAAFAKTYDMTPAEVNQLNNWSYDAEQVFDTGSVAFIIKK